MRGISPRIDLAAVIDTGRELRIDEAVAVPDFDAFAFAGPAAVSLRIRRVGAAAELAGTIDATAHGSCVRCLEDAAVQVHVDVLEGLVPSQSDTRHPLDEGNVLEGTQLDLGDLVRQLIDSALPLALTCDEACPGLCERCGHRRDACRCRPPSVETTWPI